MVVFEDESGSLALVLFFNFSDVFLGVRVPNCAAVFKMWADKRNIRLLP